MDRTIIIGKASHGFKIVVSVCMRLGINVLNRIFGFFSMVGYVDK